MSKPMLSRRTYAVLRTYETAIEILDEAVSNGGTGEQIKVAEANVKITRGTLIDHLLKLEQRILVNRCGEHPTAAICTGRDLQWRCATCGGVLKVEGIVP